MTKLSSPDYGVAEHEMIMRVVQGALEYDQVDLVNVTIGEHLLRRGQLIEYFHRSAPAWCSTLRESSKGRRRLTNRRANPARSGPCAGSNGASAGARGPSTAPDRCRWPKSRGRRWASEFLAHAGMASGREAAEKTWGLQGRAEALPTPRAQTCCRGRGGPNAPGT